LNCDTQVVGLSPVTMTVMSVTQLGAQGNRDISVRHSGTAMLPVGPGGVEHGDWVVAKKPYMIRNADGKDLIGVVWESYEQTPLYYVESAKALRSVDAFLMQMMEANSGQKEAQDAVLAAKGWHQWAIQAYAGLVRPETDVRRITAAVVAALTDAKVSDVEGELAAVKEAELRARLLIAMTECLRLWREEDGPIIGRALGSGRLCQVQCELRMAMD